MPRIGGDNVGAAPGSRVDKFYEFSNPVPQEYDPDNDTDFGDAINIPESTIEYEQLEASKKGEERGASLRHQIQSSHISSSSGKYAGKRASRSDIIAQNQIDGLHFNFGDDGGDGDDAYDDDEDNDSGDGGSQFLMQAPDSEEEQDDQDEYDIEEGGTFANGKVNGQTQGWPGSSSRRQEEEGDKEEGYKVEEEKETIGHPGHSSEETDILKAAHTKNQLLVWDEFMAIRMLLQPTLTQAIQFPQLKDFENFNKIDNSIASTFEEITKDLAGVIDELVCLQTTFLTHNNVPLPQINNENDHNNKLQRKRSRDCDNLWQSVLELNQCMNAYVGNVLDKWSGKVQVSSGKVFTKKFQSLNQGFMHQIESLFTDRDRLVKRTTHIKKGLPIFGKESQQEFDDEIYDDTDFYQVLLKELIANGAAGYGKSTDLSDAKRAKTKQHKDYLRNASKGRMVKYDVQEKLVHFMAPDEKPMACEWNLDEFFVNLFGQKTNPQSGS